MDPIKIINYAKKQGLSGIAVADHNSIRGGLATYRVNNDKNFHVIIGSEIKTEWGDVIGLFLNEEINSCVFVEVIEQIKEQGGLTILAHPYRKFKFPERIIKKVDLIEIFNARSKTSWNNQSFELAKNREKLGTSGSDAHVYNEIGRGICISNDKLSDRVSSFKSSRILGNESNYYIYHGISVAIEKIKKVIH